MTRIKPYVPKLPSQPQTHIVLPYKDVHDAHDKSNVKVEPIHGAKRKV